MPFSNSQDTINSVPHHLLRVYTAALQGAFLWAPFPWTVLITPAVWHWDRDTCGDAHCASLILFIDFGECSSQGIRTLSSLSGSRGQNDKWSVMLLEEILSHFCLCSATSESGPGKAVVRYVCYFLHRRACTWLYGKMYCSCQSWDNMQGKWPCVSCVNVWGRQLYPKFPCF